MGIQHKTAPPPTATGPFDDSICPDCEHPKVIPPQRPSILRTLLGMKPAPARCPVREEDYSALGTMECQCKHPSHGS